MEALDVAGDMPFRDPIRRAARREMTSPFRVSASAHAAIKPARDPAGKLSMAWGPERRPATGRRGCGRAQSRDRAGAAVKEWIKWVGAGGTWEVHKPGRRTVGFLKCYYVFDYIGLFGERGGTRTLDPMIKRHVRVETSRDNDRH